MISKEKKLVFMDSGIGGIPYLRWVREKRPDWQYVYLADNKYFPYGGRSSEELKDRLIKLTYLMIRHYSPDIIILACNTASVTALADLRARFSIPFVGVVPAVKPAAECYGTGRIGVLATKGTVEGDYLKELIRKFTPHGEAVDCIAASDLVDFVENKLIAAREEDIKRVVIPYLQEAKRREWSHMVLGCTHYIYLKPWFEKWKSPTLSIIDSTEGVGKRILSLLEKECVDLSLGQNKKNSSTIAILNITDSSGLINQYKDLALSENMELKTLEVGI